MPDVLILGAGAIGLSAAKCLLERGASVTVLDPHPPRDASSWGNAGYVCPSHVIPLAAPGMVRLGLRYALDPEGPFRLKPRLSLDLLRWCLAFMGACRADRAAAAAPVLRDLLVASRALHTAWAAELGQPLHTKGLLMLWLGEAGRSGIVHEAQVARDLGQEAVELDRSGLAALEPGLDFLAQGGVHFPGDAHLDPAHWMAALERQVQSMGGVIRRGVAATAFRTEGGNATGADTTDGVVKADHCVLAAGAWSPQLAASAGLRLPVEAGKGYSLTYTSSPRPFRTPMILAEARVAITPLGERLRLAGTMELGGLDLGLDARRMETIRRAPSAYFANFEPAPVATAHTWAGLRPCSPDGLPYLGPAPDLPNLVVATGHAMLGLSLAPITGTLVAEQVCGAPSSLDLRPLALERIGWL